MSETPAMFIGENCAITLTDVAHVVPEGLSSGEERGRFYVFFREDAFPRLRAPIVSVSHEDGTELLLLLKGSDEIVDDHVETFPLRCPRCHIVAKHRGTRPTGVRRVCQCPACFEDFDMRNGWESSGHSERCLPGNCLPTCPRRHTNNPS